VKIVFLAPFGIRPKGTVLARMVPLAAELQRLGHSVAIVAPPYTNPEDSGREESVRGVRLVNIHLAAGWKPATTLAMAWRMFRAALAERPDLVHLFKPKGYGGLAAMLLIALRRLGVRPPPVVVDTDDWEGKGGMNQLQPYSGTERAVFALQEKWLLGGASAVTVASRALEAIVTTEFARPPAEVFYLPNCVEDGPRGDGAAVRARHGILPEAPVLLLYTRFFEFEQPRLHRVLAEVHRRVPEARFLVVGKGRSGEEQQLATAAREEGFSAALVMAGWVEPALLVDYLAAGDVAIYPFADTLTNRTKCPAKATELLRAGVPLVADRVGLLAEYLRDGEAGILCNPENWPEMVERTVELLRDPARRQELGAAGRRFILDNFRWQTYAERLDDFYQRSIP